MAEDPPSRSRRIKLVVQYDGSAFRGWQSQSGGGSVQDALETAFEQLAGVRVRVIGAGRTDTGVHALGMPAHLDLALPIPTERLPFALARYLPDAVSVLSAEDVPSGFDARRHARLRWYRYQVDRRPLQRPLEGRAWHMPRPLELQPMAQGLEMLEGEHDFDGFRTSRCQSPRSVLTMREASMSVSRDLIAFDFKCRAFLHHMVRFMVGTLVAMGLGKIDQERLRRILEEGSRPDLAFCAPARGLCLMDVGYTEEECAAILRARPSAPSF